MMTGAPYKDDSGAYKDDSGPKRGRLDKKDVIRITYRVDVIIYAGILQDPFG